MIDEPQSAVVQRIFDLYLSGDGFRTIAHRMNREHVPSPRPRGAKRRRASWSLSAVRVILINPLCKGEQVWNRSEWIKDHERGKRRRFERPESEWIRREAPELAIIDTATWDAVRARMERKRRGYEWRPHGGLVTTRRGVGHPALHAMCSRVSLPAVLRTALNPVSGTLGGQGASPASAPDTR